MGYKQIIFSSAFRLHYSICGLKIYNGNTKYLHLVLRFGTWMTELCTIKPNRRNRMKLAEALSIRADLQSRIDQLKSRLKYCAKIQEGDQPSENVNELYKQLNECLSQFEVIVYRINRTNMQTVHEEETLTQMLARKDALKLRLTVMRDLLKHVVENDRYGRQEIKYVRTVDVGELRKVTDNYSKQLRNLDMKLQSLNWSVDLI